MSEIKLIFVYVVCLKNSYYNQDDKEVIAREMLWMAPETLLDLDRNPVRSADVFSFGLLLLEIFTLSPPYHDAVQDSLCADVLNRVSAFIYAIEKIFI